MNSETVRAMAAAEALGDAEVPQVWIFTFGAGHTFLGEPLHRRYVCITGTYEGARARMVVLFGRAWAFQYASPEAAGVERYRLTELVVPDSMEAS